MMKAMPFPPPPSILLTVSGALAVCCVLAAIALLRHIGSVEARLRAVKAGEAQSRRDRVWVAGEGAVAFITPRSYRASLQRRIDRAGLSERMSASGVLLVVGLGACVLSIPIAGTSGPVAALLGLPAIVSIGALMISIWLGRRAAGRRSAVQRSLAPTLDLLVLAMEAGLSLDAAIREVVAEWQSAASRELERVVMLSQFGVGRAAALADMAESLNLDSLRRLAGRISAAERLGSSLILILSAEAEEARRERRALASKKVAQAPTKILIPSALLVLPVTLIVLLGPAIPQLIQLAGGR